MQSLAARLAFAVLPREPTNPGSEQWWDGWIGALVAAALTVGGTIAWDARVRRRQHFEEAIRLLAGAAWDFVVASKRRAAEPEEPSHMADALSAYMHRRMFVSGLANRKVLAVLPTWLTPARRGFSNVIALLDGLSRPGFSGGSELTRRR